MPEFKTNYVSDPMSYGEMGHKMGTELANSLFHIAAQRRQYADQQQRQAQQQAASKKAGMRFDEAQLAVLPATILPRYMDIAQAALDEYQKAGAQAELTGSEEDKQRYIMARGQFNSIQGRAAALSAIHVQTQNSFRDGSFQGSTIPLMQALEESSAWIGSALPFEYDQSTGVITIPDEQLSAAFMNQQDYYMPPIMGETTPFVSPVEVGSGIHNNAYGNTQMYYETFEETFDGNQYFTGRILNDKLFENMTQRWKNYLSANFNSMGLGIAQFAYKNNEARTRRDNLTERELNETARMLYNPDMHLRVKQDANGVDRNVDDFRIVETGGGFIGVEFLVPDENLSEEELRWRNGYKQYTEQGLQLIYDQFYKGVTDQSHLQDAARRALEAAEVADDNDISYGEPYETSIRTGFDVDSHQPIMTNFIAVTGQINGSTVTITRGGTKYIVSDFLYAEDSESGNLVVAALRLHKPASGFNISAFEEATPEERVAMLMSPDKFEEVYMDGADPSFNQIISEYRGTVKNRVQGRVQMELNDRIVAGLRASEEAPTPSTDDGGAVPGTEAVSEEEDYINVAETVAVFFSDLNILPESRADVSLPFIDHLTSLDPSAREALLNRLRSEAERTIERYGDRFDLIVSNARGDWRIAVKPKPQETPVEEAPVVEAPVVEAPVDEAPVVETPVDEAPATDATEEDERLRITNSISAARKLFEELEISTGEWHDLFSDSSAFVQYLSTLTPDQRNKEIGRLKREGLEEQARWGITRDLYISDADGEWKVTVKPRR